MYRKLALAILLSAILIGPGLVPVEAAPAIPSASPAATATATLTPGGEGLPGVFPRGAATLKAFTNVKKLWFELRVEGLEKRSVHAWHIHVGTCETQGAIVINPASIYRVGSRNDAPKDLKANDDGVAYVVGMLPDMPPGGSSILTNGVPYYVNVHEFSTKNGVGPGITCGNLSTNPAMTVLTTTLTGAAEVDAAGAPNKGDLDGSGTARIQVGPTFVCYALSVSGITLPASAAHIHAAPAGSNGPVRVTFTAPNAQGKSSGCAFSAVGAQLSAIINGLNTTPSNFYVNVHTSDFPAGALRGQL